MRYLTRAVDTTATERDWHQFHAPKYIASALIVEATGLLEPFQWISEQQSRELSPEQREQVAVEMADVLLYLLQLGNMRGGEAVRELVIWRARPRVVSTPWTPERARTARYA